MVRREKLAAGPPGAGRVSHLADRICRFRSAEPFLGGAFGSSIGVDGDLVLVGGQSFSGVRESMYVFDGATGALLQTIRGPAFGTEFNAGFGTSVAAAGAVLAGSGWNSIRFYDRVSYAFLDDWRPDNLGRDSSRDTVTPVFDTGFALWTDANLRHSRPPPRPGDPRSGLVRRPRMLAPVGTSGFGYHDPDRTPSGIEGASIQEKDAGAGEDHRFSGTGLRLDLLELVGENDVFPFGFGWAVVLVESGSGQCWSAGSGISRNRRGKFTGRS